MHIEIRPTARDSYEWGERVFEVNGKHAINAVWLNATDLQIECSHGCEGSVQNQRKNWNEINISYIIK